MPQADEFPLYWLSRPSVVYGKEPVVPWEDWKDSLPACLGIKIPLVEDSPVSYDVWSYNFQTIQA